MTNFKIYQKISTIYRSRKRDSNSETRGLGTNQCKRVRSWLFSVLNKRINLETGWLKNHIAHCPRCQQRFASISRVNLALSFIKSQPINLQLLKRANEQAISVLKHNLREAPKAHQLRQIQPEPKLLEKWSKYVQPVGNMAACAAILLLMKTGIFSSIDDVQTKGQKVIRQYYVSRVGEDLTDELFPTNSKQQASPSSRGLTT